MKYHVAYSDPETGRQCAEIIEAADFDEAVERARDRGRQRFAGRPPRLDSIVGTLPYAETGPLRLAVLLGGERSAA